MKEKEIHQPVESTHHLDPRKPQNSKPQNVFVGRDQAGLFSMQ